MDRWMDRLFDIKLKFPKPLNPAPTPADKSVEVFYLHYGIFFINKPYCRDRY
jgi:hypothetical protein